MKCNCLVEINSIQFNSIQKIPRSTRVNDCLCLQWSDSGEPRDRQNLVVGVKTQSDKPALPVRPTDY